MAYKLTRGAPAFGRGVNIMGRISVHEHHIPAAQTEEKKYTRIPCEDGDQEWKEGAGASACAWKEEAHDQ
jgi:hypothetical protein